MKYTILVNGKLTGLGEDNIFKYENNPIGKITFEAEQIEIEYDEVWFVDKLYQENYYILYPLTHKLIDEQDNILYPPFLCNTLS